MHPLHDYVAKQLADKLKDRCVVVWYDERGDFQPFVDEVRGGPRSASEPVLVVIAGTKASLAEYAGSIFELRAVVEPLVSGDEPDPLVIYIPGIAHDAKASVLMELEKAGRTWKPELKQLAKNVLLQKYTLGVVDEMLPFDRKVSYEDLARAAAGSDGAEPPSILKSIFHETRGNDALLAAWMASDANDEEIEDKEAVSELVKLVRARLGLELPTDASLAKLRAITLRYVLANEFRLDLACDPPSALDGVPQPASKADEVTVRELAIRLRASFPNAYPTLADQVERELSLDAASIDPSSLGNIDTFRFEEHALLEHCGRLIANRNFDEALEIVSQREHCFWLSQDVGRKAHWEAYRLMAELGALAAEIHAAIKRPAGDAATWIQAYAGKNGWYRLDQAQRRLESWVANLDEEVKERPLAIVRRAYEDTCHAMAAGFGKVLVNGGWTPAGGVAQTKIFADIVASQPKPVAYFLVDAMRFEMGAELAERLPKFAECTLRPAFGSLPSITPIGMAALQPGASASFAVIEEGAKLGVRIDGAFLPDLASRKKFAASRVPKLVDLALDELLSLPPSRLTKKLADAQVIIVRSQEIDHAGETGFTFQARQVMDTVIDNLARAIRKLSAAGVEHAVVTADHGHLFFAADRDESMRTDPPGGDTVELHRRCWIGRGGTTPPGCIRVDARALGYDSDLDFVFPSGAGVFRTGGDLAFHHGGPSLQELVIPVLTVRTKRPDVEPAAATTLTVQGLPYAVTNRIFSVTIQPAGKNLSLFADRVVVRPILMAEGRQVGAVGMAVDAEVDRATGCVTLEPQKPASVVFLLADESVEAIRVVIQDPSTDAELYRSPKDIPVKLGV